MEKTIRRKMLLYLLISALGFSYLVLPENAGVSVPAYIIVQFACLYFLAPKKKPLLVFIPIFILALNSFISASTIWRVSNFFVTATLYSVMALMLAGRFRVCDPPQRLFGNILQSIFEPFKHFAAPVKWCLQTNKEHTKTIIRALIGIVISIPCLLFLLVMLSRADAVFLNSVSGFLDFISAVVTVGTLIKIVWGLVAGFYLFGLLYSVYWPKNEINAEIKTRNGDLLILNILLSSILVVYTIFAAIQFRYLFAGSGGLPYGLSYTDYARRGFFELIFLTGLNIVLILITIRLIKEKAGKWAYLTKALCCYLCVVTVILLASSFYRMWLYNADDGLTRLRFLVFGFLIFEFIGLIFTFIYIIKPKFNIIAVYACIGLTYYLILNIVPMDKIIAKDQIDRYFKTGRESMYYVSTLSPDAAPQIVRLFESGDQTIKPDIYAYFERNSSRYSGHTPRWQRWNISAAGFEKYYADVMK